MDTVTSVDAYLPDMDARSFAGTCQTPGNREDLYCRGGDTGTGNQSWSLGFELFHTALHHQLPLEAVEVECN